MNEQNPLPGRLKAIRQYLGLSQRAISEQVGCSKRAWEGYEKDESVPGGKILQSIAKLGIDVHWLLTGEGTMVRGDEPALGEFDEDLMISIIEMMEKFLKKSRLKVKPRKKGMLAMALYKSTMKDRKRRSDWDGKGEAPPEGADFASIIALAVDD